VAQVVECLPNKCDTLSLNPITICIYIYIYIYIHTHIHINIHPIPIFPRSLGVRSRGLVKINESLPSKLEKCKCPTWVLD
jgi:hypothetical protein